MYTIVFTQQRLNGAGKCFELPSFLAELIQTQIHKPIEGFVKKQGVDGTYHFKFNPYALDGDTVDDGFGIASMAELEQIHSLIAMKALAEL